MNKFILSLIYLAISCSTHATYTKPAHIDSATWEQVTPYFLPFDHPIRPKLDKIFSTRVSKNSSTLKAAGFSKPKARHYSKNVVSKHPKLKGYIVKLFTDETVIDDVYELLARIHGAQAARDSIERHQFQSIFVVPKKWIYPLPENPPPASNHIARKNFILIAEDLDILNEAENARWWRSNAVTKQILDALYVVVQETGLDDSIIPVNIPFTRNWKIAFIDTTIYKRWPIRFYMLTSNLSGPMKKHWKMLINNNGPS